MAMRAQRRGTRGRDRGGGRHPLRAQHLGHCLPPLLRSPLAAAGAGRQLVVRRRHRRAGPGAGRRDAVGRPARVQPRADARARPPPARHRDRRDAHARRLPAAGRLHRAADGAAAPGRGRGRLRPAGRGARQRPARACRPRVQLPGDKPCPQRCRLAEHYGSYLRFCSNACAAWSNAALDAIGGFKPTLVSRGDDRGGGAAGAGRADRLRRRGGGASTPIGTTAATLSAGSSTSATAAASTTGCCLPARATSVRGRRLAAAVLAPGAPRGAGRAAADTRVSWRPAGSAIGSAWAGTGCRAAWPGG